MAHKRIDLGGSSAKSGSEPRGGSSRGGGGAGGDQKKTVIMLSIAGVAFAIAGYFVYSTFFATPASPVESTPEVEQAFQEAVQPPPPADAQPFAQPAGSGKQSYP